MPYAEFNHEILSWHLWLSCVGENHQAFRGLRHRRIFSHDVGAVWTLEISHEICVKDRPPASWSQHEKVHSQVIKCGAAFEWCGFCPWNWYCKSGRRNTMLWQDCSWFKNAWIRFWVNTWCHMTWPPQKEPSFHQWLPFDRGLEVVLEGFPQGASHGYHGWSFIPPTCNYLCLCAVVKHVSF